MSRARIAAAIVGMALIFATGGCATTETGNDYSGDDGDLPWNTPASWEGSPLIPGINDR